MDDLLRHVIQETLKSKTYVSSTKGNNHEIFGAILTLTNPRARLSSTITKGTIYSCLGELLWYLNSSNSLEFIKYYIDSYENYSDDGNHLYGAYGPRIFGNNKNNQYNNIIKLLKKKPSTRQAVIQIFDKEDLAPLANDLPLTKDLPCTCNLQFFIREGKLDMIVTMRSNDVFIGMPHDIFTFTMIQEITAQTLGIELGIYKHLVSSLHIYEKDLDKTKQYLDEGWQPTNDQMPPMPKGDPFVTIEEVLDIEKEIRLNGNLNAKQSNIEDYWKDIIILLKIFRLHKEKAKTEKIEQLKTKIINQVYLNYINKIIEKTDINEGLKT